MKTDESGDIDDKVLLLYEAVERALKNNIESKQQPVKHEIRRKIERFHEELAQRNDIDIN
ncbi:hypothetical protein [Vibrio sinaloensis]|uniref:hypothetical protein n=1 Tax=Photobacterium sp. (strain ATCC 43367) TaxID=379097 RepID=UPI0022AFAB4A|nr:hypothetical protein [Vibrio sinaloensis]MCZ4292577.1 hypothetical protein [Vibrio sinaloensis]